MGVDVYEARREPSARAVDAFTRELFVAQNIPRSLPNVWSVDIVPGETFAYELKRPDRHFRVVFDLTPAVK